MLVEHTFCIGSVHPYYKRTNLDWKETTDMANRIAISNALVTDVYRGDKGKDYITFVQPGNQNFKIGMPSDQVKTVEFGDEVSFEALVQLKTGTDGMYLVVDSVKLTGHAKKQAVK